MGAEGSRLDLSQQQLKEIPKYAGKKLDKFQEIDLSQNQVKNLPHGLTKLSILNLSGNQLKVLSPEITKALDTYTSLSDLNLSHNGIAQFQDCLPGMKSLKVLNLSRNELCDVSISTPLKELSLAKNLIPEMPTRLPQSLRKLDLDFNRILNVEISFEKLESLSIVMNGLASFSSSARLPNLKVLNLNMNDLCGLPDMRIVTPKLEILTADMNSLEEIPHLPGTLLKLSLARNDIERVIDFMTETPCLIELDLASNRITDVGKLPPTVQSLNLSSNMLETICTMDLPALKKVNVANNRLTKAPVLGNSHVKSVTLSSNQLDTLDGFAFPKTLKTFVASKNRLTHIPLSLFKLPNLTRLDLCWNNITDVPPEIAKSNIEVLNLSMNPIRSLPVLPPNIRTLMVVGCQMAQLPEALERSHLVELCASNNQLTSIPCIDSLKICRVSRNQLERFPKVPSAIEVLDVSHNNISSGKSNFPNEFITDLDISHNALTHMPKSLLKAKRLLWFDLSYNKFGKSKVSLKDLNDLQKIACIGNGMTVKGGKNASIILVDAIDEKPHDPTEQLCINRLISHDAIGFSEMTGKRPTMEDTVCITTKGDISTFAVFDGHKGNASSICASRTYADLFHDCGSATCQFLCNAAETISSKLKDKALVDGSTAVICVVSKTTLCTCNIGDSRAVLLDVDGEVIFSTTDHKPSDKNEITRVMSIGGTISDMRLDGKLAVTRSLSDFTVDGIMHDPDVSKHAITPRDKWLILCCDGVYDVLTCEDIGMMSRSATNAQTFACDIRNIAYGLGSGDNITVIAVDLQLLLASTERPSSS